MIRPHFLAMLVLALVSCGLSAGPAAPLVLPEPCEPVAGTLFMVGGGSMPADVRDDFVKRAGGEKGKLVVIPTASAMPTGPMPKSHWTHGRSTSSHR